MFATFDRRIAEARKRLDKVQAQIAPIDDLRTERDQAARHLAELEQGKAQAAQQLEQLQIERADLADEIAELAAFVTDISALVDGLKKADRYRMRRRPWAIYSQAAVALADDRDRYDTLRQRLADHDKRIKELTQ